MGRGVIAQVVVAQFVVAVVAGGCSTFSGEDTAPLDGGNGTADSGVDGQAAFDADTDAAKGEITRVGATTFPYAPATSVTLAAVPTTRPGDVLYVVLFGKMPGPASVTAPPGWQLRANIADGGDGRALSLYHVVAQGESAKDYAFALPATTTAAAGVLLAYRGVAAPPQHIVVDASRNLTSNGKLKVPGFDLAERGRLVFVAVQTYDSPSLMTASPDFVEVANAQRIGAYDKPVGVGPTGDLILDDPFAAAHSVLTFVTTLRPAN